MASVRHDSGYKISTYLVPVSRWVLHASWPVRSKSARLVKEESEHAELLLFVARAMLRAVRMRQPVLRCSTFPDMFGVNVLAVFACEYLHLADLWGDNLVCAVLSQVGCMLTQSA
jgi:hypothetical protein